MLRRAFAFFLLLTLAAAPARADEAFRIGALNDQSGPYADLSGPGGAESARMALEYFGGSVLGKPIELLVADHRTRSMSASPLRGNGMTRAGCGRYSTSPIRAWGWPFRTWPRLATGSSSSIPPPHPISPVRPARRTESSGTRTIGRTGSR